LVTRSLQPDIFGNITYLNLVAEAMTGWRREEAIGKPLAEVFRIVDGSTHKPFETPWKWPSSKMDGGTDCELRAHPPRRI
jgi:PAS domain-containing protein